MSTIDDYLRELQQLLHVHGPIRRRVLSECRDHLADASAQYGPREAIARFGTVQQIAASLNTEAAARRVRYATAATALGVMAVGGSTLELLHSSDRAATTPIGWAIAFFAASQTAALCVVLALLGAAGLKAGSATTQDIVLLCRRNGCALLASALTMFAAAGAVPGHGSALLLLAGPILAAIAGLSVLSTRAIIRGLPTDSAPLNRSPLNDVSILTGLALPDLRPTHLLLLTVTLASGAAFVWDHQDHGTITSGLTSASVQATLVVLGYLLLGPALGLRTRQHHSE